MAYEPDTDVLRHRLALCGMQLIQHNKAWRFGSPNGLGALFWCCGEEINTGRVANYLAIEPRERLAVLAVKGTSTIEDALTDIIADTGPLHWPKVAKVAGALASAHSGFRLASYGVLHQTEAVLHHFLRPLNYRLVLTGHSLGAATACCLAKLLYDRRGCRLGAVDLIFGRRLEDFVPLKGLKRPEKGL